MKPANYADFDSNRVFFDDRNFPRGFARSGDFSLREAELLTRHGALLSDLTRGTLAPSNPSQERLLRVAQGVEDPETDLEKVWQKYLRRTSTRVVRYSCAFSRSDTDYSSDDLSDL